ncbi:transposable element Tcb1 transposase [Trichonephila clavipes]|nr:transposable element Tcb1 transposase [Trichonephila clavipes]
MFYDCSLSQVQVSHLVKSTKSASKAQLSFGNLLDWATNAICNLLIALFEKIYGGYIRSFLKLIKSKIGNRVGRNQTTVMRICDRWIQEGKTDRRARSHPPQCTTSREDKQIVRMAVTDLSVTTRTVVQHIETVTHHSVSARTIRRRLQQSGLSARRPFLGLPLTQSYRRLRRQYTHCRYFKQPVLYLRGVGASCPFLTFRAWPQPYFNRIMRDHIWHALSKVSLSITRLNRFPGLLADGKHVVHGCSTIDPDYSPALRDYTPSCHTRSTLATCGSYLVCCTPRTHPKCL